MTKEERAKRSNIYSHLGVEILRTQHETIRAIAKSKDISISQLVRLALNEYLARC